MYAKQWIDKIEIFIIVLIVFVIISFASITIYNNKNWVITNHEQMRIDANTMLEMHIQRCLEHWMWYYRNYWQISCIPSWANVIYLNK